MAIQVNGTQVIGNSRELTNIASVDATTAASIGAAGVGGASAGQSWFGIKAAVASRFALSEGPKYVMVGGSSNIQYSSDLKSWTNQTLQTPNGNGIYYAVAWNGTTYCATNNVGGYAVSTNGTSWTVGNVYNNRDYRVAWGNGIFLAGGSSSEIIYSTNGTSWGTRGQFQSPNGYGTFTRLAYGAGKWVAAESTGYMAYSSNNGTSWTFTAVSGLGYANGLSFGNGKFVVGDNGGNIWTSTNGTSWTQSISAIYEPIQGIANDGGNNWAVVTINDGLIGVSDDNAANFKLVPLPQTESKYGVAYDSVSKTFWGGGNSSVGYQSNAG